MTKTGMTPVLDHVVVNAMFETDAAAACFDALGFALTPRGYHSLGSVNHLMMFGDHYLELVGLPVGSTQVRREILESRLGIDGLVFKTDDAQSTYTRLTNDGVQATEPQTFSRPVQIGGVEHLARFVTTRLAAGELPAGRIYFCEHRTPQWVFRDEWSTHPNGAQRLVELVVVSADPVAQARRYALVAGGADVVQSIGGVSVRLPGFDLLFVGADRYRADYGALACHAAGRDSYFGALVIAVKDLAAVRTRLTALTANDECAVKVSDTAHARTGAASVSVLLSQFNTLIEFIGVVEHAHS